MIVSFAWTSPALVAGAKTVTRRDWTPEHAARFKAGQLVDAWDRSPRTRKGRKIATIRILNVFRSWSDDVDNDDVRREGFLWLRDHAMGDTVDRVLDGWSADRRQLWVVEFELVDVVPA